MSNPAAFSGDYTDLRFIKTRSVAAITIEIPIEQAADFVAAFGAPVPSSGCPVAIARIQPSIVRQQLEASVALIEKPAKERRSWSALSYAEQAGIRCNEQDFWQYIAEAKNVTKPISSDDAAAFVRMHCRVDSRSEIKWGTEAGEKWCLLDIGYGAWSQRPIF